MKKRGIGMIEKIKNIKLSKKQQTIISLAIIFIIMLILNVFTPLIADDYDYKYIYGTNYKELVKNIFDVFISQYNHYMTWGGTNSSSPNCSNIFNLS